MTGPERDTPRAFTVAYVLGVTPGKWAGVLRQRMPRHPVELRLSSRDDAVASLLAGTADVALVRLPVEDGALSSIPLYVEEPVVVVPKDHAIAAVDAVTLADLDAENVLHGQWSSDVELVAANTGVVVLPQSVARALARRDVVARPVTDGQSTRVALVWRTEGAGPLIEEFIGIVRGRTVNSSRGTPTPRQPRAPRAQRRR